ncbi:hypothetical protein F8388_003846 [Cannabis sativa]|nr:hypothetical protein F8388_003846 [Cannabis sativa]
MCEILQVQVQRSYSNHNLAQNRPVTEEDSRKSRSEHRRENGGDGEVEDVRSSRACGRCFLPNCWF